MAIVGSQIMLIATKNRMQVIPVGRNLHYNPIKKFYLPEPAFEKEKAIYFRINMHKFFILLIFT